MTPSHIRSYYAATADPAGRPPLSETTEADVCVVGAGFTGLSTALHLAEHGLDVVVLEAQAVGWGASGRNGGQLVNSYSRDIDVIEKRHGRVAAEALARMMFEGGDIIRALIARHVIDCDYRPGGAFLALNRRQWRELVEQQQRWAQRGNVGMRLVQGEALQQIVLSDRYTGALVDPRSGHLHPLKLAQGQAAALEAAGGRVYESSRVVAIERGARVHLRTATGAVAARFAVLAGNAYLGGLVPELAAISMPCGTQITTTEVLGAEVVRELMPADYCVEDCNYLLDYFRRTADHRLLFGGGVTYGGGDPASIERFLRPRLERVFPRLRGVRLEYSWGGDFLLTVSRLPQLGRLTNNLYYAQGYSGHGVCTTHLAGRLIAEAITQQAERFDSFAALPHQRFPGGRRLRAPLTALAAHYYALRDRIGV